MRLICTATVIVLVGCGGGDKGNNSGDGDGANDDGGDGGGGDDGDTGDPGGPDGSSSVADAGGGGDAAGGYVPLVTATWSLAPGSEGYICGTRTLTEDVYAGALRPMAPLGTHHTTVSIGNPTAPDDESFPCGPEFGDFWASGVGTQELVLPDGVGLLARAGQQLKVSLHLFNATDRTLSGVSGLEVRPVGAADVEHVAKVDYYGPMSFSILDDSEPHTVSDEVQLEQGTLVGIFPHMHQLGTHFRAELQRGGDTVELWDDDYQFESQEFAPLAEVPVEAGDVLQTSCTWVNTTEDPVGWGTSSTAEMCFTILLSYPP
jgi:hypothetical protein